MYTDLDRPPLQARALNRSLPPPWREVRVLESIGSTNDYVAALARAGAPEGLVVVAEHQFLGRGRLDRRWVSPPRAGLTFSVLLRPDVVAAQRPWLPMLLAAAAAEALGARCDLDVALKWPNDLLVDGRRKVAGVLAETTGDAVVVGFGVNVATRREELPRDDATSLAIETGGPVDRGPVLLALLRAMGPAYADWLAGGDARHRYLARCDTVGRAVRVLLPGDATLDGEATDVDDAGRLVVTQADGTTTAVSAGDVVHVRPV